MTVSACQAPPRPWSCSCPREPNPLYLRESEPSFSTGYWSHRDLYQLLGRKRVTGLGREGNGRGRCNEWIILRWVSHCSCSWGGCASKCVQCHRARKWEINPNSEQMSHTANSRSSSPASTSMTTGCRAVQAQHTRAWKWLVRVSTKPSFSQSLSWVLLCYFDSSHHSSSVFSTTGAPA